MSDRHIGVNALSSSTIVPHYTKGVKKMSRKLAVSTDLTGQPVDVPEVEITFHDSDPYYHPRYVHSMPNSTQNFTCRLTHAVAGSGSPHAVTVMIVGGKIVGAFSLSSEEWKRIRERLAKQGMERRTDVTVKLSKSAVQEAIKETRRRHG